MHCRWSIRLSVCLSGDCQGNTNRGVCQPCEFCYNPHDSFEYNDCGHCPPPPPPPMPDKCLVLDETITESCTAVPADEGEFLCPPI